MGKVGEAGGAVISRRQAFCGGAALLVAKVLAGALPVSFASRWLGWLSPAPASAQAAAPSLTLAEFAPLVGSRFDVRVGRSRRLSSTLVDAAAPPRHRSDRRGLTGECFSILFDSGAPKTFEHGTYVVEHPSLGAFPLFLVAVGTGVNGQRYEAVVNRRAPSG